MTALAIAIGDGTTTFISVTNGSGLLVLTAQGLAASFTVSPTFNLPGVTLIGGSVKISINTGTVAVNNTLTVAGTPVTVDVPAGPYVRVEVWVPCCASGRPVDLSCPVISLSIRSRSRTARS